MSYLDEHISVGPGEKVEVISMEKMPDDRMPCEYCGEWGDCRSKCISCGAPIGMSDQQKAWLALPRYVVKHDRPGGWHKIDFNS